MSNDDNANTLTRAVPRSASLESDDFRCDNLQIQRVDGREGISQLFRFDVLAVCADPVTDVPLIDPDDFVGSAVQLHFHSKSGARIRTVFGIVAEARVRGDADAVVHPAYELVIVPRAFRLGLVKIQEVFLNMTVPEIIQAKLERQDLDTSTVFRLEGKYEKREYVVQYNESDLAFISRLAEHVGMSFHFEHDQEDNETGVERLVFTDHGVGFQTYGDERIAFSPRGARVGVYELSSTGRLIPTMYVVSDYSYAQPILDIDGVHNLGDGNGGGVIEFGSNHLVGPEGESLAKVRAQEARATRRITTGSSVVGGFTAGAQFTLADYPLDARYGSMLITAVEHHLESVVGQNSEGENRYHNTFTAVPADYTYRPPRVTPRPRIHGLLTGVVQVGSSGVMGGDAKLDSEGRYQVQLHLDAAEYEDRNCSLPVRMAQPFAGPAQGMHYPLRPGTEVAVGFVGGDPDRPVIVGAIPNAQTRSVVTNTSPHMHRVRSRHGLVVEFGKTL